MGTKIYVERVAHTHHCLCPVHGDGPGLAGLWVRPVQYGLETRARMASIWSCPVPTYFAYQAMWPCTRGAFIRCLYLVPLFGAYAGVACAAGGGDTVGAHRCRSRAAAGPKPVLPRACPGCTPPGLPPGAASPQSNFCRITSLSKVLLKPQPKYCLPSTMSSANEQCKWCRQAPNIGTK